MRAFTYGKMHAKEIALAGLAAIVALLVIREAGITRNRLPLEVSQKVRNLSAKEMEWQVATTAQPGDVLVHFALLQLPADYLEPVRGIRITAATSALDAYRQGTFTSRALGATGDAIFTKSGIAIPELAPGEFIDLAWQTSVSENTSFAKDEAPLLASAVAVSAHGFSESVSRTVASLFSTTPRSRVPLADETFYQPRAYSMNPRAAYEDLGTGVLIAGEDLAGVAKLAIKETGQALAWRLVSNELLEAGIPAGLAPGAYTVVLSDQKGKNVETGLSFEIRASGGRAVVVAATPSLVRKGEKRTIVLQGIRLDENLQLSLSRSGSRQVFALENPTQINERVLFAEIPATITVGSYTILVGETEQDARITVN